MLLGEGLVGKVLIRFGGDLVGDAVVWKGPWKGLLVTSILALIGGGRLCFGGGHFGKILKCHKEINYRCLISFWSGVHVLLVSLFGIPIIRSISNFFGRLKKKFGRAKKWEIERANGIPKRLTKNTWTPLESFQDSLGIQTKGQIMSFWCLKFLPKNKPKHVA